MLLNQGAGMKTRHCCRTATREQNNDPQPASRWRHGGEIASWIIPSATLLFMPKCPLCVAAYLAVIGGGVSISMAGASTLRASLLTLSIVTLLCMAFRRFYRHTIVSLRG